MGQNAVDFLDVIRNDFPNDAMACCSRMFTEWLRRTSKASWKQLIEALKEIKLTQLGGQLDKLLKRSVEVKQEKEVLQQSQQLEGS